MPTRPKVATCLSFNGDAEEATRLYTSLLPNSHVQSVVRLNTDGPVLIVEFTLADVPSQAIIGGPQYRFTEAASISVTTADQDETDRLWTALTSDGGSESQCGWLEDRFGMSWQIVPETLIRLMSAADRAAAGRAMHAMMSMRRIDIAALEAAFLGA